MPFKNFLDKKFDEIIDFVEKHKQLIDADVDFRKKVNGRLRSWLRLGSLVDGSTTIEEFQNICKDLDLQGCITFYIKKLGKNIKIIPDEMQKKYEKDTVELKPNEFYSLAELAKTFDAEIVEIK